MLMCILEVNKKKIKRDWTQICVTLRLSCCPLSYTVLCAVIVASSVSITQSITDGLKRWGLRSRTRTLIPRGGREGGRERGEEEGREAGREGKIKDKRRGIY